MRAALFFRTEFGAQSVQLEIRRSGWWGPVFEAGLCSRKAIPWSLRDGYRTGKRSEFLSPVWRLTRILNPVSNDLDRV